MQLLHAIRTVGSHTVVAVDLSGNDAHIEVMFRTFSFVGALTQRAGVDLVSCRPVIIFAHAEQPAGLFPLTLDFLNMKGSLLIVVHSKLNFF